MTTLARSIVELAIRTDALTTLLVKDKSFTANTLAVVRIQDE
jgi:hypothetical protein